MPSAPCLFIKRIAEFVPQDQWNNVPDNTRGIYALLQKNGRKHFDVVYIGMSAGEKAGTYSRLKNHIKRIDWTHFTVFEVHDNVTDREIRELEGLFRHIYRRDSIANKHNKQLCHKPFSKVAVSLKMLGVWGWEKDYKP
jgi:hypothetical protein